jgi:hypothetical protein
MSEPFLERLSRFTPDAGRLDRDALLFAAGRGSVRPNRGWITLATLLASTQALSLVLLWPRPTPHEGGLTVAVAVAPTPLPPATLEPRTSDALASPGTWSARQRLLESETEYLPDDTVTLIDSGPPLKIFGPLPPSLLN